LNPVGRHIRLNNLKIENDPWSHLLKQLSGVAKTKPRALQAHQRWSKDHFETHLKAEIEEKWACAQKPANERAAFCDLLTRIHFLSLDEDIRKTYENLAESEGIASVKAWKDALTAPASKLPADRQR
jgi:hypothetical protein